MWGGSWYPRRPVISARHYVSLCTGQQRGAACDREAYLKESSINNYIHINFGQVL